MSDVEATRHPESMLPGSQEAVDGQQADVDTDADELYEVPFVDLARRRKNSPLPPPLPGGRSLSLPLGDLDPEVLERVAAELIKRRPNRGAHFYGRRGQEQHGLDIVERETDGTISVYQVRRYQELTPGKIISAVTEYADPKPPKKGGNKPPRRFGASRYVLLTSAEFETEKALQDQLEELQAQYAGDLVIEVWGREQLTAELRDCGALVTKVFGPEWARETCGFTPPPPAPADPDPLGLVENPVLVLGLDALESDAKALETANPLSSAHLYGVLADSLEEANFPVHAAGHRRQQAKFLRAGQDYVGAFTVLWGLALAHFKAGAASNAGLGDVYRDLDTLRAHLDELQIAKLDILITAQNWYERGSRLGLAVPALEAIRAANDQDAGSLTCFILEQAIADGWFDYDTTYSIVGYDGNTPELLSRLRQWAGGLHCNDVVIRARLACALADASLTADSSPADVDTAFKALIQRAGAGRFQRVGGLVYARAAYAFAMHGDTVRAIDLWRQAIRESSEARLYGDVLACQAALNAAIFEQSVIPFSELSQAGPLPNTDRLLASTWPAEPDALRAAHAGRLPDALGVARRYQWESRLSGQLSDERDAVELVGDVMLAAGRPDIAIIAWVMAGEAEKAPEQAAHLNSLIAVAQWAESPVRARQAAAARVIGAQARLYGTADAEQVVHTLLSLTAGLWTTPRIAPHPELDAVNALSKFGSNLPASAVDPVLNLLELPVKAGRAIAPETVNLLIQLYWAVPARQGDLAKVIGHQLALADPPPYLREMVSNLPGDAREPATLVVSALADAGHHQALLTLAKWGQSTPAVQLAARRTCAHLLRQQTCEPSTTWSLTSLFRDAVRLLLALSTASTLTDVDPLELRSDAGPVVTGGTWATMITAAAKLFSSDSVEVTAGEQQDGEPATPLLQSGAHPGSDDPGQPATEKVATAPESGSATEPDRAAVVAAGPLDDLTAAVAGHLLATAESPYAPAFVRADALAALHLIIGQLPPELNGRLAGRFLAIAENPALTEHDQAELASQDLLSRGRFDMGARDLPMLALVCAATAASQAAEVHSESESLPAESIRRMIIYAVKLLHSTDRKTSKYGAITLALASKCQPGLGRFSAALLVHPSDEVRSVAASIGPLDETTQLILAGDPSPGVRIRLASRASELDEDIIAGLAADVHPDVLQALAGARSRSTTQPDNRER